MLTCTPPCCRRPLARAHRRHRPSCPTSVLSGWPPSPPPSLAPACGPRRPLGGWGRATGPPSAALDRCLDAGRTAIACALVGRPRADLPFPSTPAGSSLPAAAPRCSAWRRPSRVRPRGAPGAGRPGLAPPPPPPAAQPLPGRRPPPSSLPSSPARCERSDHQGAAQQEHGQAAGRLPVPRGAATRQEGARVRPPDSAPSPCRLPPGTAAARALHRQLSTHAHPPSINAKRVLLAAAGPSLVTADCAAAARPPGGQPRCQDHQPGHR